MYVQLITLRFDATYSCILCIQRVAQQISDVVKDFRFEDNDLKSEDKDL